MKIISFILSTTMLIQSVVPTCVHATAHTSAPRPPYIGTDDFKEIFERGNFVDKSLFIKALVEDEHKAILITRPRRWGKSLNMSMLKYFFHPEVDKEGKPLDGGKNPNRRMFQGTLVADQTTVIKYQDTGALSTVNIIDHFQGQHPTILLSLKDVKENTFEGMRTAIESQIVDVYAQHKYLPSISRLWKDAKKDSLVFKKTIRQEILQENKDSLKNSLKTLSEWLYQHHGKKVYILIDEYDTPLHQLLPSAFDDGTNLLRGFFGSACKSNIAMEKCLFTGILRIAKAGLFSDLNNLAEDSLLNSKFARYYGFTQEEVDDLFQGKALGDFAYPEDRSIIPGLEETTHAQLHKSLQPSSHGFENLQKELKRIYNGYRVGGIEVYNPWSIVNVLVSGVLSPYWVNSGGIAYIKDVLFSEKANEIWNSVKDRKSFSAIIQDLITMSDVQDPNSLASLLFHAGYLTLEGRDLKNVRSNTRKLIIPNEEVHREFKRLLNLYAFEKIGVNNLDHVHHVFHTIITQDTAQLEAALADIGAKTKFTKGWNFNFLHAAALTGNEEIFARVLGHDKSLLDGIGIEDSGVADYAALAGKSYYQLTGYTPLIQKPGFFYGALCSDTGSIVTAVGAATAAGWVFNKAHDALYNPVNPVPFDINMDYAIYAGKYLLIPSTIGATIGWVLKNYILNDLTAYCTNYHNYNSVDASKPASFNSIKQFEKYLAESDSAYVSLNAPCKEGTKLVGELTIPAVNVVGISVIDILLRLCNVIQQEDL